MFQILDLDSKTFLPDVVFETGKEAAAYCKQYFLCSYQPREVIGDTDWRKREITKFESGVYSLPPFLQEYDKPDFFLHISEDNKGLLAYTKDELKGKANIQSRISLQSYLEKFWPELKPTQVELVLTLYAKFIYNNVDLLFATTSEEIVEVYKNYDPKVKQLNGSCMIGDFQNLPLHPVAVYGAGDLAIAYLTNEEGKTTDRALCWPARKIYSRVYGANDRLHNILKLRGFEKSQYYNEDGDGPTLEDAKFKAIEVEPNNYLMPYFDENYTLDLIDDGDGEPYFVVSSDGSYEARRTDGVTKDLKFPWLCASCKERHKRKNLVTISRNSSPEIRCDSCLGDEAFYCSASGIYYLFSEFECVPIYGGIFWEKSTFELYGFTCERSGIKDNRCNRRWVYSDESQGVRQPWHTSIVVNEAWYDDYKGEYCSNEVERVNIWEDKKIVAHTTLTNANLFYYKDPNTGTFYTHAPTNHEGLQPMPPPPRASAIPPPMSPFPNAPIAIDLLNMEELLISEPRVIYHELLATHLDGLNLRNVEINELSISPVRE